MSTTDYVGVPDPRLVYVLIADREKFDKIALAETDHGEKGAAGHLWSKRVDHNGVRIVFQHWQRVARSETGGT